MPPQPQRGVPGRPAGAAPAQPAAPTSWDHVAVWYDKLVGEAGGDFHAKLILPAAMEMLDLKAGEKVLDLCCGQGVFSRLAAQKGAAVLGVDASPRLIQIARKRAGDARTRFEVADARRLGPLADGSFDAAACIMAVHDVDDVSALLAGLGAALKTAGRAVIIMMHPCFRIPRQSSWGWDDEKKTQYRRLDRYASQMQVPIATHPGADPGEKTLFYHRPLETYFQALQSAGLATVALRELVSHRLSEPGGRSRAENRSRQEFPVFLALKVIKLG